ncbi:MAG: hypothetical protein M3O31_00905, partial [Acidobacteriota bacterium]|nr:hypothetical protein [Acidobacteriota bacterium]
KSSLAMIVSLGSNQLDVGREGHIAGGFLPDEVEGIRAEPHIFAAAGDGIGTSRGVKGGISRVQDLADIAVVFKDSDLRRNSRGMH